MFRIKSKGDNLWIENIYSGTNASLYDVFFLDNKHGFAVGSSGTILETNNGGSYWYSLELDERFEYKDLVSIAFVNEKLGYLVTSFGQLYVSYNGGENWSIVNTNGALVRKVFVNHGTIFLLYADDNSSLYASYNDGKTFYFKKENPLLATEGIAIKNKWTGEVNVESYLPNDKVLLNKINQADFNSMGQGFAVGNGILISTTDNGKNWYDQNVLLTKGMDLDVFYNLYAPAPDSLFGCGYKEENKKKQGTFFASYDNGLNLSRGASEEVEVLRAITYYNKKLAMMVGANGMILRTKNGEDGWEKCVSPVNVLLRDVQPLNDSTWFIVGNNSTILKTKNFGVSWEVKHLDINIDATLTGISILDKNKIVVVGVNNKNNKGIIFRSFTGGQSFSNSYEVENCKWLSDVEFVDANIGFVSGDNGKILRTIDGGDTWRNSPIDEPIWVNHILFLDHLHGYAACDKGVILETSTGGAIWNHIKTPVNSDLMGLCASFEKDIIYACGANGTLLFRWRE
jgi:photosystem II stability/assembly factor-like uncharacterized protein